MTGELRKCEHFHKVVLKSTFSHSKIYSLKLVYIFLNNITNRELRENVKFDHKQQSYWFIYYYFVFLNWENSNIFFYKLINLYSLTECSRIWILNINILNIFQYIYYLDIYFVWQMTRIYIELKYLNNPSFANFWIKIFSTF